MQQPSSSSPFNASVSPDLSGLLSPSYRVNQAQDLPFFCPLQIDRFDIAAAGSGQNGDVVTENAPGVGGHGGSCTCPNGKVYQTGDNNDNCGSLACVGGVSGTCNAKNGPWSHRKVVCAASASTTTTATTTTTTTGSQRAVVSGLITKASINTIETSLRGGSYLAIDVHTYAVTNTADDGRGGSREDNAGNGNGNGNGNVNASTSTSVGDGVGGGFNNSPNPYKIGSPAFVVRPSMGATTMALAFISLLIFVVTAPTIFAVSTFRRMPLRGAKGLRDEMENRQSNQGGAGGAGGVFGMEDVVRVTVTEMEDVDGEKGGGDEAEGIGVDIRYAPLYMTLVQILHTTIIASTAVLRPVAPVASLGVSATAALVYVSVCLF